MRTLVLAFLSGILAYGLPGGASAQSGSGPQVCPPGHMKQNGTCVPRPRNGPGRPDVNGGPDDIGTYIDVSDNLVCQGPGGYSFCSTGNTGPYGSVRRPPGH